MRRWIVFLLVVSLSFLTAIAQEKTGAVRVSVRVAGTPLPIPGAQLTLVPWVDCGDCLLDLPDNEQDLLTYLTALAAQRGTSDGVLQGGGPVKAPSQPIAALLKSKGFVTAVTDADGSALFPNLAQGTYQVTAQREGYKGGTPPFRGFVGGVMPSASSPPITIDPEHLAPLVSLVLIPVAFAQADNVSLTLAVEQRHKVREQVLVKYRIENIGKGALYVPRGFEATACLELGKVPRIWAGFVNSAGEHFEPGYGFSCGGTPGAPPPIVTQQMSRISALLRSGEHLDGTLQLDPTIFRLAPDEYRIEVAVRGWKAEEFTGAELTELAKMGAPFLQGDVRASAQVTLVP